MNVIINPGTEPVESATIENATINMEQLIKDSGQVGITYERIKEQDADGRFAFKLESKKHEFSIDINMPGCKLEKVSAGKPFYSPRLYVDGSSWLWGFALGFIDFHRDKEA